MNQTEIPSLNPAISGFVFNHQKTSSIVDIDRKALEVSCVNLICKLENVLAKAMEQPKDDFVDESAAIGRSMIEALAIFCGDFLSGESAEQIHAELERALTLTVAYQGVLKARPLTNALLRTFWHIEEKKEIKEAHAKLGEALVRACAATLYQAVMLIGMETAFGKEIDQSTAVYVNELQQFWK